MHTATAATADRYDLVWLARSARYAVRHVGMRSGTELDWSARATDAGDISRWRWSDADARPDVIMVTLDSYSAAVRAIGNYPTRGAYV